MLIGATGGARHAELAHAVRRRVHLGVGGHDFGRLLGGRRGRELRMQHATAAAMASATPSQPIVRVEQAGCSASRPTRCVTASMTPVPLPPSTGRCVESDFLKFEDAWFRSMIRLRHSTEPRTGQPSTTVRVTTSTQHSVLALDCHRAPECVRSALDFNGLAAWQYHRCAGRHRHLNGEHEVRTLESPLG